MGLRTLVLYLLGNRAAILQVATTKHALWLGLLFVLSAGFAREYDGEDLLHEPWHLLIPLGASLATCSLLFALLWFIFHGWRTIPNPGRKYTEFLTVYWMTAPLAWIYAIPVERFFVAKDAMVANLCLLGFVSVWRVMLIARAAGVLLDTTMIRNAFPVLFFADSLLIVLIAGTPGLLVLMGGVRADTSEGVLQATATFVGLAAVQTWLIWLAACVITLFVNSDRSAPAANVASPPNLQPTQGAWRMAASSLLIWIVILPFTQPQQWRRQRADHLSRAGKYPELISYLSSYPQSSFPPHWDPPPRNDSRTRAYDLLAARSAFDMLPAEKIAPWVRNAYMTKFADEHMNYYHPLGFMSPKETQHTRDLLQQLGIEHEGKDHQELEARIREYRNRARNPSGI